MGYVTGQTCDNELHITYTEKGMEYLSGINTDKTGLEIKYFSLGDSDVNYQTYYRLCKIPDLTGVVDCISGTKINAIKYEIRVIGTTEGSNIKTNLSIIQSKICCE